MATSERRQREREARRREIVDAAEAVMRERGLWATTMEDVAAKAQLSKGTIYLYFDTKDALCAAIAERALGQVITRLEEAAAGARTGRERLRSILLGYAEFFEERPHLFRMAVSWILTGIQCDAAAPALASYRHRIGCVFALLLSAIEQGREDASFRADIDPVTAAGEVWGGFIGVLLLRLSRDEMARRLPFPIQVDMNVVVTGFVDTMLSGLSREELENKDERTTVPRKKGVAK